MSTNKTQNYALHSWSLSDDFQLSEINQNFAALDAVVGGKAEIVTGFYTGTGASSRVIDLGRKPLAVLVELNQPTYQRRAFALRGHNFYGDLLKLTDTGFSVSDGTQYSTNCINCKYLYLAVVE